MSPHRRLAVLTLLLGFAFLVRFVNLDAQSFWYDEGYAVMLGRTSAIHIAQHTARYDLNTPLHGIALRYWLLLTGESEFTARALSAFASLLTAALVMRMAGRGNVIAGTLIALAPVELWLARDARMYALLATGCVASTAIFLLASRRALQHIGSWLAWSATALGAFATHVLAAGAVGAQAALLIWQAQRNPKLRPAALIALVTVGTIGALGTWLLFGIQTYGVSYRDLPNPLGLLMQALAAQVLPRLQPDVLLVPAALGVGGMGVLCGLALRRQSNGLQLLFVWLIGVLSVVAVGAFSGKFASRYPTLVAPLFVAMLGMALARVPAGGVVAGALTLLAGFGAWQLHTHPLYANEDFRGAVRYLRDHLAPDERVVLVSGHFAPVFAYYWGDPADARWLALPDDPVLNIRNTLTYSEAMPALNRALSGTGGAWLLQWQEDIIDPTGLAAAALRRQAQALGPRPDTPSFHGLRLAHYRFFQPYRPVPEPLPVLVGEVIHNRAEVGLSGLGCYQPHAAVAGGLLEVWCFWQIQPFVMLPGETQVSLRLLDATGAQVVQSDQAIAPRGLPGVFYEKPIWGVYFFPLPAELPAGEYVLQVIPYNARQGEIAPQIRMRVMIAR